MAKAYPFRGGEASALSLDDLRAEIDRLDAEIVDRLHARARLAREAAKQKRATGDAAYDPARERQLLDRLVTEHPGDLPASALSTIYQEIIAATRALQTPLRIAYAGQPGTFTHQATLRRFGPEVTLRPTEGIAEVFDTMERGDADHGVVPIEDAAEGVYIHTLERLGRSDLQICSEIYLALAHALLGHGALDEVQRVYLAPEPREQCRKWLGVTLRGVDLVEASSTGRAAEHAAADSHGACIGPKLAAQVYHLAVLADRIEDDASLHARFLVLGQQDARSSGNDKTTVMVALKDEPGALHRALEVFARHQLNLTMVQSRPSRDTPWEDVFFLDVVGHREEEPLCTALRELSRACLHVKVIGSYPQGQ